MDIDTGITNSGTINGGQSVALGAMSFGMTGTTVSYFNCWSTPQRISVEEVGDTIEMVFTETSNMSLSMYPPPPERRVFKIIYSCKEGKWDKSERIYGEIIPAQDEDYVF